MQYLKNVLFISTLFCTNTSAMLYRVPYDLPTLVPQLQQQKEPLCIGAQKFCFEYLYNSGDKEAAFKIFTSKPDDDFLIGYACVKNDRELLTRLIKLHETHHLLTSLIYTAGTNNLELLQLLHEHTQNCDHEDQLDCYYEALAFAADKGYLPIMSFLCTSYPLSEKLAQCTMIWEHVAPCHRTSPTHKAAESNQVPALIYLLKRGACYGYKDGMCFGPDDKLNFGRTELTKARKRDHKRIVTILETLQNQETAIKMNLPPQKKDEQQIETILSLIRDFKPENRKKVYQLLIDCPPLASERIKDDKGNTILHHAAACGDIALFRRIFILNPGLFFVQNKDCLTPLVIAFLKGHFKRAPKEDARLCDVLVNVCFLSKEANKLPNNA